MSSHPTTSLPLALLSLLLLLLVHLHPTAAQPNCNSVSCAPDTSSGCIACNTSSTQCNSAWNGQPGYSCGTAVGKSSSGRDTYNVQCCPQRYMSNSYHCQPLHYTTVSSGGTYEVDGYTCMRDRGGMSAAAIVGVTLGAILLFGGVMLLCYTVYRRQVLAAAAVELPLLSEGGEDGSYSAPLVQPQTVQPYSTQPYNLDMQQPYAAPPYGVRAEHNQPAAADSRS